MEAGKDFILSGKWITLPFVDKWRKQSKSPTPKVPKLHVEKKTGYSA